MNVNQKEKGFTIIEVVLVLAIAGLIFLMVFIALPALQRSQRDTARKNDVGVVAAAVTSYTGNNRGDFPADAAALDGYVKQKSQYTTDIFISGGGSPTYTLDDGQIQVTLGTRCGASGTNQELIEGTAREYTVFTKLESGDGAYFCQNS